MLIASISQEHTQTMSFKAWCSDKILQVNFISSSYMLERIDVLMSLNAFIC